MEKVDHVSLNNVEPRKCLSNQAWLFDSVKCCSYFRLICMAFLPQFLLPFFAFPYSAIRPALSKIFGASPNSSFFGHQKQFRPHIQFGNALAQYLRVRFIIQGGGVGGVGKYGKDNLHWVRSHCDISNNFFWRLVPSAQLIFPSIFDLACR